MILPILAPRPHSCLPILSNPFSLLKYWVNLSQLKVFPSHKESICYEISLARSYAANAAGSESLPYISVCFGSTYIPLNIMNYPHKISSRPLPLPQEEV